MKNSMLKYEFSNILINYLDIELKPYTINEIKEIVKKKIFNGKNKKEATWEDKDIFNCNILNYNYVIDYIFSHYVLRQIDEPKCYYYHYYQLPIEVKKLNY